METKDLIPVGMFVITVIGIIGTFFKAKGMDEAQQKNWEERFKNLHEIDEQQWKKIDELKIVDANHEKEDWKMRSDIELKIAGLDGVVGKLDGKMDSIVSKIDEMQKQISSRLDKIEAQVGRS